MTLAADAPAAQPRLAITPFAFCQLTGMKNTELTPFTSPLGIVDGVAIGTVKRTLIVTFECCQGLTPEGLAAPDPEPDVYLPRVRALLKRLDVHGQLRELHRDDGEYT